MLVGNKNYMGLYTAWEFVLTTSAATVKDEFDGELHAQRGVVGSPLISFHSKESRTVFVVTIRIHVH